MNDVIGKNNFNQVLTFVFLLSIFVPITKIIFHRYYFFRKWLDPYTPKSVRVFSCKEYYQTYRHSMPLSTNVAK